MKAIFLAICFLVLAGFGPINMGGGVDDVVGGSSFTDCATDGGSMIYCQDFEATGGGNPSGETPAMTSSFGPNCDYATAPAPLHGAQSCFRNTSGNIADESAHTAISGQAWWQFITHVPTGAAPANFSSFFRPRIGTTNTSFRVVYNNFSDPTFDLVLYCDGSTFATTSSALSTGTTYVVKITWSTTDGVGELFACPYDPSTDNPFDSCTTSLASCNGSDGQAGPDGWRIESNPMIVDAVLISSTDLSP